MLIVKVCSCAHAHTLHFMMITVRHKSARLDICLWCDTSGKAIICSNGCTIYLCRTEWDYFKCFIPLVYDCLLEYIPYEMYLSPGQCGTILSVYKHDDCEQRLTLHREHNVLVHINLSQFAFMRRKVVCDKLPQTLWQERQLSRVDHIPEYSTTSLSSAPSYFSESSE